MSNKLPKGQKARSDFPRFGLPEFTDRFPQSPDDKTFTMSVNGDDLPRFDFDNLKLSASAITADFHCVTTWSYRGARWQGVSFKDLYKTHIESKMKNDSTSAGCVFTAQDGSRISLLLTDLLQDNVMLADSLDGEPLSIAHGAPLRLVAPAHYGYKNLKYVKRIDFYDPLPEIKHGFSAFLEHPRAQVAFEERGRWVPGWVLRLLYRPLIGSTVRDYKKALDRELEKNKA